MNRYAPLILRGGIAFVFLWFGCTQLYDVASWTGMIPDWAVQFTGMTAHSLVYVNALGELIIGVLLALGFQTRIVATLLAIHLCMIVGELGLNAIGIRDVGLIAATLSIALAGPDTYSIDA